MKTISLYALILITTITSCSLYDLRPDTITKVPLEEKNESKAAELILQSAKVHGWDSLEEATLTLTYQDQWPGFILKTFFRPWPSTSVQLTQSFDTKDLYTSSIQLLDGKKKGEIWGLDNKKAYKVIDGKKVYKENKNISFYLPAYQYFIELPLWATSIPKVTFCGEQKINNKTYQVVFGTWNSFEPQKDVDQYLFYFEKDTKRLGIVEYTIRDVMASAHGANWFSDFKEKDGILIPFKQTITGGINDDDIVHEITLSDFSIRKKQ